MNNRFLEEYLIYFNIWLMQWENVQYLVNSENYWYRSESEKPGLWVKMTWEGNWFHLNPIHLLITKSSLILASDRSWVKVYIQNIWNIPKFHIPPPICGQGSEHLKILNFEDFDLNLKIEPDLRYVMSQKFLFWWWVHILRFTSKQKSRCSNFEEKIGKFRILQNACIFFQNWWNSIFRL